MGKSGFWKEIRRHANLVPTPSFRLCSLFALVAAYCTTTPVGLTTGSAPTGPKTLDRRL